MLYVIIGEMVRNKVFLMIKRGKFGVLGYALIILKKTHSIMA